MRGGNLAKGLVRTPKTLSSVYQTNPSKTRCPSAFLTALRVDGDPYGPNHISPHEAGGTLDHVALEVAELRSPWR